MKDREGADRSGAIPGAVPTDGNDDLDAMDAGDLELLAKVSEMYEALDPTPEMLPDLVLFGLQAVDLDAELARLVESELLTSAGAGSRAVEQARRVTFSSDHLTVMVAVSDRPDGAVRLDGWSTPGGGLSAELRANGITLTTTCDSDGRFVFDEVPAGMVQLTLSPTGESDPAILLPVVTPAIKV